MREEGDAVDPHAELEESDSEEGEDARSIPPVESKEEDNDGETLADRMKKRQREVPHEEGQSSKVPMTGMGSSSAEALDAQPMCVVPPPSKKKKYAPDWLLGLDAMTAE